ncbi:conjugal transfer protein TraA [Acetobacter tropicalis NBRC 101654]|uniref:Conjugal transfer protein TraA n=1 Tax=Acetobacter tropicalis NBRC 101654 TaxID=749388 RepID=F7VFB2_9PROT|nr:MobF family relaxase [Acetobacter tropicalis]GAA09057.1 conjugal transfer protein TraA [Acetobacter tropicalis NBRC 101654]
MVATVSGLTNAAQASAYYEAEDYYSEDGNAPSVWLGKGAAELGLFGEIDQEAFTRLLHGEITEDHRLGTSRDGEWSHRPGWDLTFSAPKSVSVMAEVAGDRRLIEAHEAAVQRTLSLAEQHLAATRIREDGEVRREVTQNLVIASFRHGTSRALDPQLHSHNVILNMTQDHDGQWRSLEPRALYQLQKQLGALYRQELAHEVTELGYEITKGKDSSFEIAGLSPESLEAFSQRAQAIEAQLAERGKSRAQASAAEKQTIALDTRQAKEAVPQAELVQAWREAADSAGLTEEKRRQLVAEAQGRLAAQSAQKSSNAFGRELLADQAVAQGAAMLGERNSVFATTALHEAAGRFAIGAVSQAEIAEAITRAETAGGLEKRTYLDYRGASFEGMTTAANIAHEMTLLRLEEDGRHQAAPILSPLEAGKAVAEVEQRSALKGHTWNEEQRAATTQILTSNNQIVGLQGYAGTAKTSTVLATVAKSAEAQGYRVTALAPTASAAQVLGDALDSRADTLARHLLAPGRPSSQPQLWIVDEASLVSAKDMAKLLSTAQSHRARVLLVGDIKQLGSIEAGAAFEQLQEAGMETARLTSILRQTNEHTKAAVEASLEGNAKKALEALDRGGGRVVAIADREGRFAQIAEDYAALSPEERQKTLVIEPSREGRDALTQDIRNKLIERGQLGAEVLKATKFVSKDLTKAEAKRAESYELGDIVRFAKDYADKGVSRHGAYRVIQADEAKNVLTLQDERGRELAWHPRQWGAAQAQVYREEALELRVGDRVQFTRNDKAAKRVNGQLGEVITIDPDRGLARVKLQGNRIETLNLESARDRHFSHAYASTAFAAQGRTAERVFANAESSATHLLEQKSFYVALSRAKVESVLYTDDRSKMQVGLQERAGIATRALKERGADMQDGKQKAQEKAQAASLAL